MKPKKIVKYCIESMQNTGADKSQCYLIQKEKNELNVERGEITPFRTNFETSIQLTAIMDGKKGTLTINKEDKKSIDVAVEKVLAIATISEPDSGNDISEKQASKIFDSGPSDMDANKMYDRLEEFLPWVKKEYPKMIFEQLSLGFQKLNVYFQNSNEADFQSNQGFYNFMAKFTAKVGNKTSSPNYCSFSTLELDKALKDEGLLETLIQQSSEQINTQNFSRKITGDVIITPHCLDDFFDYITSYLSDYFLISDISVFKDKLNELIAAKKFTLHSKPVSKEIANGYFITSDGYEAKNSTIIEKGVLRTFLLSLYGANKTGHERAVNSGGCYVVDPGNISFEEMVKNVKSGILLCSFSGGNPSNNADFSVVAKNSYYIKDGKIQHRLSETMISGNLAEMLKNIVDISKERVNFGNSILPWIRFKNIIISGK
ncbi:MAG: metallopeptidase TldD-related protein [Candidatus Cloacimonadota bacterium]|nr:metallopeptidase TldD-related protein [Candidatus Cloacimonadota bacterium]